jgi:hypothetical protein
MTVDGHTPPNYGSEAMEPISLIVGALAMGAVAAAKQVGGDALKDAYAGLKRIIEDRYKRGGAIQALQEDPSSEAQKKALEDSLTKVGADKDPDVVTSAKVLTQALAALPQSTLVAAGIDFERVKAVTAQIGDIDVSGLAKGFVAKDSDLSGAKIGNIKVHSPN